MKKAVLWCCGILLLLCAALHIYVRQALLPLRGQTYTFSPWETADFYAAAPLFFLCLGVLLAAALTRGLAKGRALRVLLWVGVVLTAAYAVGALLHAFGYAQPTLVSVLRPLLSSPALFLIPGALVGLGL